MTNRNDVGTRLAVVAMEVLERTGMGRSEAAAVLIDRGTEAEALFRQCRNLARRSAVAAPFGQLPNFHIGGRGPGLVLLNGWTASGLVWPTAMVGALERNFTVVRIDNRGSGWSRQMPRPFTIGDLAADAERVIDSLAMTRPIVVGLSMGGMIGQELAMRAPAKVGQLVLLGTRPPSPEHTSPPAAVSAALMGVPVPGEDLGAFIRSGWEAVAGPGFGVVQPAMLDEMVELILARLTRRGAVLDQARAIAGWHGASRLRRLRVPTTVVHGELDPLLPVHNGMRLAQLIPEARYVELRGIGHLVPFEAQATVLELIQALPPVAL